MPVLRQRHTQNFTVVPNSILQDKRLSFRDTGLLIWMLSKPTDWKFTKKSILEEITRDGERSLQEGIKNLQKTGYLKIARGSRKNGKLSESIWTVYDTPQLQNAVMEQSQPGKQECETPQLRFPSVQNAVDYKERINKRNKAAPALEGGAQLPEDIFFDQESGEFRRKGSA